MSEKNIKSTNWKPFLYAVLGVVALWLFTLVSFTIFADMMIFDVGDRGTFGDMFGGLNALFTGLAFAGVIYTMILQREDLRQQMRELSLTRETLQEQRTEMEAQNTTLRVQSFEASFFNLLKHFDTLVEGIRYSSWSFSSGTMNTKEYWGRHALKSYVKELGGDLENLSDNQYAAAYNKFADEYREVLGRYASTLNWIMLFLLDSDIENSRYAGLLSATLSTQEKALIYYICELDDSLPEDFQDKVRTLGLLDSLSPEDLIDPQHAPKSEVFSGLESYEIKFS